MYKYEFGISFDTERRLTADEIDKIQSVIEHGSIIDALQTKVPVIRGTIHTWIERQDAWRNPARPNLR